MMILDYIYASIYEMTKYLGSGDRTVKAIALCAKSIYFYTLGIYSMLFGVPQDLFFFLLPFFPIFGILIILFNTGKRLRAYKLNNSTNSIHGLLFIVGSIAFIGLVLGIRHYIDFYL